MLSSTKRYIMHAISLVLGIGCLAIGLMMKYGNLDVPIEYVEIIPDTEMEVNVVSMDSVEWLTDVPTLSNPD